MDPVASQLNAELVDNMKMAALIAAVFINRQALIILAFHIIGEMAFLYFSHLGVYYFCIAAALYSINATVNIKLSYRIRQALICIGAINWLAALDYFVSSSETIFYVCYPWLINGLDVFILFILLNGGGWRRDRVSSPSGGAGNHLFYDLQLCDVRKKQV